MRPILFHFGTVPIYSYGLSLAVAFLVGSWIAGKRARQLGVPEDPIFGVATWAFVAAIVGSRLAFLIVEAPTLPPPRPDWWDVQKGGLVFYGGFIGAILASIVYLRIKKLEFWKVADVIAPVIALGHGFVRIGCFMNGCCYGRPVKWGVVFPSLPQNLRVPRHPTQLYESVAGIAFFFLLLWYEKKVQKAKGELVLAYVTIYGITRFLIEFLREDERGNPFLGLYLSQWLGLIGFAGGLIWLLIARKQAAPTTAS